MEKKGLRYDFDLVLFGGSAGSLEVLLDVLQVLRPGFNCIIIIVVHRKNSESILEDLLKQKLGLPVFEAEDKMPLEKGSIFLAPPDYHLLIEKDRTIGLDYSEKVQYSRPSIDVTFETAAEAFGGHVAAVLLSGANADGTKGCQAIRSAGGYVVVQDPEEATVNYMPLQAITKKTADAVLNAVDMKSWLQQVSS